MVRQAGTQGEGKQAGEIGAVAARDKRQAGLRVWRVAEVQGATAT